MIKRLISIAIGAVLALEIDRWWSRRRARLSPSALTGSLLDKVNERLETRQRTSEAGSPVPRL